ncbi:serine/threonine protein kinase [Pseudorhodoferax soli]|uniref:Non-specific serine/threonine protein kinase n=1 Tax=Pseudorhodoferax soli TaxID=545864 RepID=A0A368Y1U1_9BURK|nr:serine/threonine-protein kinase [Pseudorhodoferax soli]RCW74233.1 non-specific serine/threonine protein kinase [Pseudorhodoferax soli]
MNATARYPSQGLPPGTRLAEFELHGLLGAGGFGMVYRAYDHSLHRTVAIKEYLPGGLADRIGHAVTLRTGADARRFEEGLRSFMNEARLLAQFDHPALVKVLRVWEQNRTAYMAMPLYQGVTLKEACAQMRAPPPEPWLRKLLWSVLQALELLHRRGTVHRDISPDNIFLQDIGPPVLLDLGAARQALGQDEPQHTAILKVNYAPIEQYADAEGMRQGPWSDVYALAAVVYGCLNQAPPVPASVRVLRDSLRPPAELAQELHSLHGLAYTPALVEALTAGLALDPERRPRDLAAFGALLQLQPVPGMERFDWRAELGPGWSAPRRTTSQAHQDAPTQWQAPLESSTVGITVPAPAVRPAAVPQPTATRATRGTWWPKAGVAALVLGLLAAVGIVASPGDPPPAAVAPAPPRKPAKADTAVEVAAPAPAPAPLPPAPMPPEVLTPVEPPVQPDAPPPARRAPTPPRALSAEQICPDSNFFTRPMCLFRACQQARYAAMPVCVENTRRLRENHRPDAS